MNLADVEIETEWCHLFEQGLERRKLRLLRREPREGLTQEGYLYRFEHEDGREWSLWIPSAVMFNPVGLQIALARLDAMLANEPVRTEALGNLQTRPLNKSGD